MQYRREIDGLRAIAVLPVIFFHAGFDFFSGGYVGVDIFFVISGYLITGILIGDLERGTFSICRFYERRARRILPALFFVMLACLPFAYLLMIPAQMMDFAASLFSATFALSNFYFLSQVDYFAPNADLQPLLHTWSLGVEEQYYFLFPITLFLLWKFGRNRAFTFVVLMSLASLAVAEWGWRNDAGRNFYFTLSRLWEIGAGSICAFLTTGKPQRSRNFPSLFGLLLIAISIFYYDKTTPFPSVYSLTPIFGTALIILYGGQNTLAARFLSFAPLVGIGLISYSAYLWHQPIFAFARLRSISEPSTISMLGLVLLTMILAYGSWRWVERPFRRRHRPILTDRASLFLASGLIGSLILAISLAGYFGKGFEWRFTPNMLTLADASNDQASRMCHFDANRPLVEHPQEQCLNPNDKGDMSVLLLGDSHARAISEGLGQALIGADIGYYYVSYSACVPLRGFIRFGSVQDNQCASFVDDTLKYASASGIETVVLAGRFPLYLHGDRYDNGEGGVEAGEPIFLDLKSISTSYWDDDDRRNRVLNAYEQRIRETAQEFNVVLVYPIPEAGWDVPRLAAKNAMKTEGRVTTSYNNYKARSVEVLALFNRLVDELPNVYAAPVQEIICSEASGRCVHAEKGNVYYSDDDHLSNTGARLVSPMILKAVKASLRHE